MRFSEGQIVSRGLELQKLQKYYDSFLRSVEQVSSLAQDGVIARRSSEAVAPPSLAANCPRPCDLSSDLSTLPARETEMGQESVEPLPQAEPGESSREKNERTGRPQGAHQPLPVQTM